MKVNLKDWKLIKLTTNLNSKYGGKLVDMSGVVNQTTAFMDEWNVHTYPSICPISIFIILYFKVVNLPHIKSMRESTKTFTFDMIFWADTTQAVVYNCNETPWPIIVDAVLEGYDIMDEWMDR